MVLRQEPGRGHDQGHAGAGGPGRHPHRPDLRRLRFRECPMGIRSRPGQRPCGGGRRPPAPRGRGRPGSGRAAHRLGQRRRHGTAVGRGQRRVTGVRGRRRGRRSPCRDRRPGRRARRDRRRRRGPHGTAVGRGHGRARGRSAHGACRCGFGTGPGPARRTGSDRQRRMGRHGAAVGGRHRAASRGSPRGRNGCGPCGGGRPGRGPRRDRVRRRRRHGAAVEPGGSPHRRAGPARADQVPGALGRTLFVAAGLAVCAYGTLVP